MRGAQVQKGLDGLAGDAADRGGDDVDGDTDDDDDDDDSEIVTLGDDDDDDDSEAAVGVRLSTASTRRLSEGSLSVSSTTTATSTSSADEVSRDELQTLALNIYAALFPDDRYESAMGEQVLFPNQRRELQRVVLDMVSLTRWERGAASLDYDVLVERAFEGRVLTAALEGTRRDNPYHTSYNSLIVHVGQ